MSSRSRLSRGLASAIAIVLATGCTDSVTEVVPLRPTGVRMSPSAVLAGADSVPGRWIIRFRDDVGDVAATARQLIQLHGAQEGWIWDGPVKGFSVRELPDAAVSALQRNPLVRLVEPVRQLYPANVQALPFNGQSFQTSPMWYLDRIDHLGSLAFDGQFQFNRTGVGVHLYVVDSGVRGGHVEFTGRIGNGACFITLSLNCSPTIDALNGGQGHGTTVASAAAGSTFGVAKQAIIHPVRIEDGETGIPCDDIVSGLNWVWFNAQRPAVVNLSIGGVPNCFSVRDAMDALVAANILVFKSAGNDNIDAFEDRANRSAGSVIVGAIKPSDARSAFSNWGSLVSLMAPGEGMLLATAESNTAQTPDRQGTSFASPLAAGVAATLLQDVPTLTAPQLKQMVLNNASAVTIGSGQGVANRVLFSNFTNLTAYIDGPTPTQAGTYTYSAIVAGGLWTYTYRWYSSPNGTTFTDTGVTTSSYTAYFWPGTTWLRVVVVSGVQQAAPERQVNVQCTRFC